MKRTKERTEVEIENEERQAIYANHITTAMRDQGSRFVINPSFASVEDLNFGRMAFLGMNSEIEAMQAREKARLDEKEGLKNEKDVQDDEMAAHFRYKNKQAISFITRNIFLEFQKNTWDQMNLNPKSLSFLPNLESNFFADCTIH